MTDHLGNPTSPADMAVAVTKSDTTDLGRTKGLYIGGAGDVAVTMRANSSVVTFSAVPAGAILPVAVSKVMATNTTATLILALY